MTASSLRAALRAGAEGLYALEAATGLITGNRVKRTRLRGLMSCMNVSASGSGGPCPPGVGVPAEGCWADWSLRTADNDGPNLTLRLCRRPAAAEHRT